MIKLIEKLCSINAPSGSEDSVSDFIIKELNGYADVKKDSMGNLLVFKKGKNRSKNTLMCDAHTDEVGMIITAITSDGFLKFETLGGINETALVCKKVLINNSVNGVIGIKPVHLCSKEQKEKLPEKEDLYIDIGADSKEEAEKRVNVGDTATFISDFTLLSDTTFKAKAIDDRIGCAVLISLLKKDALYDFYATFTVQEELGCRGAKAASYAVSPDFCLCLEATTAADLDGIDNENKVCSLGKGTAVSFMDRATLYDKELYNEAINSGILCQPKAAVTGGNNSGAIHLNKNGVRTLALSVPCRYIHSASSIADISDIESTILLAEYMINKICSGEIK